jgi:hypothetical protein
VAEAPMAAIRDGGDERWVWANEAPEGARVIERRGAGEVYLETDRGERKATGSYYTPQYIVEYIVEHAVGPLVEEAVERVKGRAKEAKTKAARAEAEQSLVDEILSLKTLDPAMGSGHFLVEATEFLALALATDPYVETAETPEEDLTYWKRRVVERCIYGVDKNPLAVELAKLSLWLATVAADRPLSFLDHHLKCGDSLIGARVEDLGEVPPVMLSKKALKERKARYDVGARQANLFETRLIEKLPVVMGRVLEITEQETKDYDTVRAKEAADQAVQELKAPFEAVADLWTSAYFGNEFINGEYDQALMAIGQPQRLMELEAVQRAREMAEQRRFFHWELAFPEVFYDEHGQRLGERAGFDAVVGNPPYIQLSMEEYVDPDLKTFLPIRFGSSMGRLNTFGFFLKRGMGLVAEAGYESMIVPNTVLTMTYYTELREMILDACQIQQILTLDNLPFEDAVVENVVLVLQRDSRDRGRLDNPTEIERLEPTSLQPFTSHTIPQKTFAEWDEYIFNPQLTPRLLSIRKKTLSNATLLGELVHINQAIALKHDRARWLFEEDRGAKFKPILDGRDVSRYSIKSPGVYLKYDLEAVHSCKREDIFLTEQKILFRRVGDRIIACYDDNQFYALNTLVVINLKKQVERLSLKFLLTLLNSYFLNWYFVAFLKSTKEVFSEIQARQVEKLPIRRIDFTTPADERERLVADGITQAAEWIESAEKGSVKSVRFSAFSGSTLGRWLDERLSAEPEEGDVVHDLLAHLAERMIAMHEEKQERVEAFWLDLEGVTGSETFAALREHGKWESSLWKAEPCRPFVDGESRSTRHLDESLGWNEDCFKAFVKMLAGRVSNLSEVVGVYRTHHPAYDALVRRIEATDRLIDLMVYRLYGLTADEVAVVEGGEV